MQLMVRITDAIIMYLHLIEFNITFPVYVSVVRILILVILKSHHLHSLRWQTQHKTH